MNVHISVETLDKFIDLLLTLSSKIQTEVDKANRTIQKIEDSISTAERELQRKVEEAKEQVRFAQAAYNTCVIVKGKQRCHREEEQLIIAVKQFKALQERKTNFKKLCQQFTLAVEAFKKAYSRHELFHIQEKIIGSINEKQELLRQYISEKGLSIQLEEGIEDVEFFVKQPITAMIYLYLQANKLEDIFYRMDLQNKLKLQDDISLAELGFTDTTKMAERWVKRFIGEQIEVNYSDFDLTNALEMNYGMLKMKERYPEVMERITFIGTIQEVRRREYEHSIEREIQDRIKKAVGEKQTRNEIRNDILKDKIVTLAKVPMSLNGEAGRFFKSDNSLESYVAINKLRAENSVASQRIKAMSASRKFHAIGLRYGTIIHELGHHLHFLLRDAGLSKFSDQLWYKNEGKPINWWRENISVYGSKNHYEMFAELFSEYFIRGNESREEAKDFGKKLEAAVKKYRDMSRRNK